MGMSAAAYARQLRALLPPGKVWDLESDSVTSAVLLAMADELARVDARGVDLIEETDPRTATETLDDWERMLSLPDEAILAIPVTDAERRLAVTQKLVRRIEQNAAFFIALAAACGYVVTINDELYGASITRAGRARAGTRTIGIMSAYYWIVSVQTPTGPALTTAELEAIITRAAPAHTTVIFAY